MSLATDANKLLLSLQAIVSCSENYAIKNQDKYIAGYASSIKSLVSQYESAINISKSKETAKLILSELAPKVEAISMASTKGEMKIFDKTNTALNEYWELYTIFRESKYINENL